MSKHIPIHKAADGDEGGSLCYLCAHWSYVRETDGPSYVHQCEIGREAGDCVLTCPGGFKPQQRS